MVFLTISAIGIIFVIMGLVTSVWWGTWWSVILGLIMIVGGYIGFMYQHGPKGWSPDFSLNISNPEERQKTQQLNNKFKNSPLFKD